MRRFVTLLQGVAALSMVVVTMGPAAAKPLPLERRLMHPDGVSIQLQTIDLRDDSIVLSATIVNPGEHEISLDRARSFVLDDGAHGIYHLSPPADDPELRIPPHMQVAGDLVFIGPLASAARQLTLSSNRGIGSPDNPYDDAPVFDAKLPLDRRAAAGDRPTAVHPAGVAVLLRHILSNSADCVVSLVATNGNDRTIVLNQDHSLVLTDQRGAAAPLKPPVENQELVVPSGSRLDAELVFDCRPVDASAPLTLVTNRGTAGTSDNPYDPMPVLQIAAPVERSSVAAPANSRASVAPITRSHLAAAGIPVSPDAASPVPAKPPSLLAPKPDAANPVPAGKPPPAGQDHAGAAPATPPPPAPEAPGPTNRTDHSAAPKNPAPGSPPQAEASVHAAKTDQGLHLVLPADQLFGSTRDTIEDAADPLLAQLVKLIATTRPHEVVIAGHTDSAGTDEENQALSKDRAHAVVAWLQAHAEKPRPRFVEQGYGRTRPVAPNHVADGSDNPEGRSRNRRVEITLRR
jgi:outer membrane protein OmpA-like peptidoglycan-associated protein